MKRILSILLVCVLLLCGCSTNNNNGNSNELKELDVVLDWYPNALHAFMYVAIEKGFEMSGYDYENTPGLPED